jgi:zinc transporter ZupT
LISGALASVTPVAVLISYFVFRDVSEDLLGILLALAGGSFLYVGAADLLPEGQATGKPVNTVLFFIGASLIAVLRLWTQ